MGLAWVGGSLSNKMSGIPKPVRLRKQPIGPLSLQQR